MDALHSLRIETKRLRYTLEFLRPLLDPEIDKTLDHLIRIQDHLGHLQDTAFACEHWAAVRAWGTWDLPDQPATLWHRSEPEPVPAAASYWNDEREARDRLRAGGPAMWADTAPAVIRVVTTVAETWRDKVGQIRYNHTDEEHEVIVEGEMETSMNNSEPTYVILLGPPASGKGTQASRLEDELAIPHVSSGDLFRYNLKNETALGLKAKTYMDKGALVPDDVTIAMVLDRLSRDDCEKGALLDGFPRTIPQAEALDEALAGEGEAIDLVLNIQVPEDVLIKRVTGRRLCRQCGASYHLEYSPPEEPGVCDECGGELYQRDDDTEETARKRLDVYREQTQPLVDYYGDKGIVVDIDGDQSIDAVTESLLEAIEENV
jgi:adenylate kinase